MMEEDYYALISIIVPIFNVEKYLRQCIDSLLSQTYENIEIIMIDDGSEDSSGDICDEYANNYNKCRVIHKANAGLGMARNTGMEHMKGRYVTFMDSDDWAEPDLIESLYRHFIENHVDLCKGGFQRITDEGKVLSVRKYNFENFKGDEARFCLLPRMMGSCPFQHDSVEMCVCGCLYNAQLIKKFNLKFPSERELISEDLVFNIDYMQHVNGACLISEAGYNYRLNLDSLTTSYRNDRFEACRHFYLEMKAKCENLGYDKMVIYRLQRMFFVNIRTCIFQENTRNSALTRTEHIKNIEKICTDKVVQEIIREYPKRHLGIMQNIFLMIINFKWAKLLFLIAEYGRI